MRKQHFILSEFTEEVMEEIYLSEIVSQASCKAVLGAFGSLHCLSELTDPSEDAELYDALVGQLGRRRPRLSGFVSGVKKALSGRRLPKVARAIFEGFLTNLEAIVGETSSELDDVVLGVLRVVLGVEPTEETPAEPVPA